MKLSRRSGGASRCRRPPPSLLMMAMIMFTAVQSLPQVPQTNIVPPVPGLPANLDITSQRPASAVSVTAGAPTTAVTAHNATAIIKLSPPTPAAAPQLTGSYLPAVMQAVAYYVELLQYEIVDTTTVEPPFTLSPNEDDPATSAPATAGTHKMPVSTTQWPRPPPTPQAVTTPAPVRPSAQPTAAHAPGYYAPVVLSQSPASTVVVATGVAAAAAAGPDDGNRAQLGMLPLLSVSSQEFFNWFLQSKDVPLTADNTAADYGLHGRHTASSSDRERIAAASGSANAGSSDIERRDDSDLQYLHQLPSALLQDIWKERYEQPALLDADNVNEFRRVYDDFYGSRQPLTGKKRIPPTKPYVQMLMLYDLLKRDARRLMLNKFEGYNAATLDELNETARGSAERQLYTLFQRMIDRNDMDKDDIRTRCQAIMIDLINPNSITAKALRHIPPLQFRL